MPAYKRCGFLASSVSDRAGDRRTLGEPIKIREGVSWLSAASDATSLNSPSFASKFGSRFKLQAGGLARGNKRVLEGLADGAQRLRIESPCEHHAVGHRRSPLHLWPGDSRSSLGPKHASPITETVNFLATAQHGHSSPRPPLKQIREQRFAKLHAPENLTSHPNDPTHRPSMSLPLEPRASS
ncbi:hypothetical protein BDP67DRAFT_493096 [Colletotrichum lupini]|nr:hypothetical protein BDP67DRAFT_493096 [Colletotrichum lupini]